MVHHGILCIGCNTDCENNAAIARQELANLFPILRWARPEWTIPVDFCNPSLFLDQVAEFSTELSVDEIHTQFKEIERKCGRRFTDKAQGVVRMDVDLLVFDGKILKVDDWQREYVQHAMEEITSF